MDVFIALEMADIIKDKLEKKINEKKLDEIIDKINYISQTCNEIILRDLRSAYKSLDDYIACKMNSHNELLDKIENSLFKNTGLNTTLNTGSIRNADLVALSYYGLAFISVQKEDYDIAYRYIIRMFESGSRLSRTTLSPTFFEKNIKHYCNECYMKYKERINNLPDTSDYLIKAGAGIYSGMVAIGAPILGIIGTIAHPNTGGGMSKFIKVAEEHASDVWKSTGEEKEWLKSQESIKEELEKDIDLKCTEVAIKILKGIL